MTIPVEAYLAALAAMHDRPKAVFARAALEAEDYGGGEVSAETLHAHMTGAGPNDPIRQALGPLLATWDAERQPPWSDDTEPGSPGRRQAIYRHLGFDTDLAAWTTTNYPPHSDETIVITAQEVEPWYTPDRKVGRFYWDAYTRHLREVKGWRPESIGDLDRATDDIVEQIADPSSEKAYAARGLVVGYVQSGKTANFTGVVAKAIDAGYRHVLILTGTIELLRGQTQRRIDMELLGIENLLGDADIDEITKDPTFDYAEDDDWPDGFMRLGTTPEAAQRPRLVRYTRRSRDYQELHGAAAQLRPVKQHPELPLYNAENLTRAPAGIFVIKKNAAVLAKLGRDLARVNKSFLEIPVLIIDDESDQASVNTVDPQKVEKARREGKKIPERTAINRAIATLLADMPRAQYLGYTATPFANVFIDPGDVQDIFPRDFVVGLKRPHGYMGASDFSDLGTDFGSTPVDQRPYELSNRRAYVRELVGEEGTADRRAELRTALDTFVLTGAVKLYREDIDPTLRFAHHTMLIHESVRMAKHGLTADTVKELWNSGGYSGPACLTRLEERYESDILPVSAARREPGVPIEPTFQVLQKYIGDTVARISEYDGNPVIVVNGDADIQRNQQQLDFDSGSVWRVLVGGAKLSRGFTVEGLTVTYYRRVAQAHDTLTQAGRWFGFRPGYRDLVRIFIGTNEKRGKTPVNLLEAFDAVVQDEEAFRSQLTLYSRPVNGEPQLRPIDIPPLVSQHLFWLKPTANNKMFNAVLEEQRDQQFGPVGYPLDRGQLQSNLDPWLKMLDGLSPRTTLRGKTGTFDARLLHVDVEAFRGIFANQRWLPNFGSRRVKPWLAFFDRIAAGIDGFVVVLPQSGPPTEQIELDGLGKLSVVSRQRRTERGNVLGEPTEPRHRIAAERLSGIETSVDPALQGYLSSHRGALLSYFVRDSDNPRNPLILATRIYLPQALMPVGGPVVRFRATSDRLDSAVVDVP